MKLGSFFIAAVAFALPALAVTESIKCSDMYGDPNYPLRNTACASYFIPKDFLTLGSLPVFPYVGAMHSAECGSCWQITYEGISIDFLVVDHAAQGIEMSNAACSALFDNDSVSQETITISQVDANTYCGMDMSV